MRSIAETINRKLKLNGAWFFQVKADKNGKLKLLEFATRQSSTMGLYRQSGINFALLSIFNSMNIDVSILDNKIDIELDRCLHNKYKINLTYSKVYIDYDDTIIVNDAVNEIAIQYLYQCKRNNIKICLLTKHYNDLYKSLDNYCISKNLFDEIIILDMLDDKVKYINSNQSIFIDNYFIDREKVKKQLNIPVFDVDAIECLLK